MKVLFANIPFFKFNEDNQISTGPNAGSRWPWTAPGLTDGCIPFPFFMAYATQYLIKHGIDAELYDGVALRHWNDDLVREAIASCKPDVLILETSTPLYRKIMKISQWAKKELACRIVLVGPHIHSYATEIIREPFIDHCVVGEYELPTLDIVTREDKAKDIYSYEFLDNIDTLDGDNFMPYRQPELLYEYWEGTMYTPRVQLQMNTSRGCPFKCTYCQWPKVMNNGRYRARSSEMVIDEIKTVMADYKVYLAELKNVMRDAMNYIGNLSNELHHAVQIFTSMFEGKFIDGAAYAYSTKKRIDNILNSLNAGGIQSILFDDDTWNIGNQRIIDLCHGLKDINVPWTMMGRTDTSNLALYDLMVESGCVGMRFGIESFNQKLLNNTKKRLNAQRSFETLKYLITRYSNMEFHFTTMKNLPGEKDADWNRDVELLNELKEIGERHYNRIHWQNSDCIAFPGTELWEEMVSLGKGEALRNFDLYDGSPHNNKSLAEAIGWLGSSYQPHWSEYSKLGEPTHIPD
jgi:radical SAM superfamily enzyme YgiQ (UPF0313 family)